MKKIILLTAFLFSLGVFANEGVSTNIDPHRLDDIQEWINNSKATLDFETASIEKSPITDQEGRYENLILNLLKNGSKPNEFLMRNILFRTQVVYKNLQKVPSSPQRDSLTRRVLQEGLQYAQDLYQPDMTLLELAKQKKLPAELRGVRFAEVGLKWAKYMLSLYYLTPTNDSRLQLMRDMMGLMYNDINDDDGIQRILAPISQGLIYKYEQTHNLEPKTSVEKLMLARDLRRFMEQHLDEVEKLLASYDVAPKEKQEDTVVKNQIGINDIVYFPATEEAAKSIPVRAYRVVNVDPWTHAVLCQVPNNSGSFDSVSGDPNLLALQHGCLNEQICVGSHVVFGAQGFIILGVNLVMKTVIMQYEVNDEPVGPLVVSDKIYNIRINNYSKRAHK